MKAVGLYHYLPIGHADALLDVELETPVPAGRDLLIEVKAIAVNPVDYKIRSPKEQVEEVPRVLGWDVAGVVTSIGPEVTLFKPGDQVYYAGSVVRQGGNSEFHLVDERIVGRKPENLTFAEAASLPLTTITAWEALFDRLGVSRSGADAGKTLLIIGGAGGVGSIAIQLAKRLAGLKVVATASRPESVRWVRELGADEVIDHNQALAQQLQEIGVPEVDIILCLNDTDQHFPAFVEIIKPQGKIGSIVSTTNPVALDSLMSKSVTFCWEMMFTRSMFNTPDISAQNELLNEVAKLVEQGIIKATLAENLGRINATNLKRAHKMLEDGHVTGKLVLEGF